MRRFADESTIAKSRTVSNNRNHDWDYRNDAHGPRGKN